MPDATIYDVAIQAKVSIATVSRVINFPHQVSGQTRQRVLMAIDQLGFVPKAEATARARKSTGRIGVLTPFFTQASFVQRLRGVAQTLSSSTYELVIYSADSPAHCRSHLASLPIARRLDGLVVMSLLIDDEIAERLQRYDLPTVLVETTHPAFSSVTIDNEAGGHLAAEFLWSQGYHRLGFIGGDSEIPGYTLHTSALRMAGYRKALEKVDQVLLDHYIGLAPFGLELACQQMHKLLDLPQPPSGIFAASDTQAMGVLKAARSRGLKVPDDLAVIGFDDLEFADYIGLTTISQSLDESGRIAVELLLARLTDPLRAVQHVQLPLKLIQRQTA
ncbi:MAG: LacI family DNA-binding transcriptional regulator [Chloroflexi bacterium]|nr:LacI family DNA-binding transcriptional regulator [Chloroflexota bacterium]